jgi:hypothetical protein
MKADLAVLKSNEDITVRIDPNWLPSDDPKLLGWWDATDEATIKDSNGDVLPVGVTTGTVNQWDDKSGNGNDLTSDGGSGRATTYAPTDQINGLNALGFAQADTLQKLNFLVPSSNDIAVYIVAQPNGHNSGDSALWHMALDTTTDVAFDPANGTDFYGRLNFSATVGADVTFGAVDYRSNPHLFGYTGC